MDSTFSIKRFETMYEDRGLKIEVLGQKLRATFVNKTIPEVGKDFAVVELEPTFIQMRALYTDADA